MVILCCITLASNKNWARAILPEFSPPFCFLYSSIPHSNQHHYSWRECLISIEILEIFLKFLFNSISFEWLKEGKLRSILQFKYLNEKIKFETNAIFCGEKLFNKIAFSSGFGWICWRWIFFWQAYFSISTFTTWCTVRIWWSMEQYLNLKKHFEFIIEGKKEFIIKRV